MKLITKLFLALSLGLAFNSANADSKTYSKSEATNTAQKVEQKLERKTESKKIVLNQVNINTASADELVAALNGIGLKKAEAIVKYREEHGAFASADDLVKVSGIGAKTLEKNRAVIIVK